MFSMMNDIDFILIVFMITIAKFGHF